MNGATYICSVPDRCVRHDQALHGYPCEACQDEWRAANPRTAAAITEFAGNKGSLAKIRAAEKADAAARAAQPEETQQ